MLFPDVQHCAAGIATASGNGIRTVTAGLWPEGSCGSQSSDRMALAVTDVTIDAITYPVVFSLPAVPPCHPRRFPFQKTTFNSGWLRCISQALEERIVGIRQTERHSVGVAMHRRCDDQGSLGRGKNRRNPTDRGKSGTKRSVLTDGGGIPLGLAVSGANTHDIHAEASLFSHICGDGPNDDDVGPLPESDPLPDLDPILFQ